VNKIKSIGAMVVVSVVISGNLAAQQTSSAVQVVTFGVARSPQMLVNRIASIQNATTIASALISETFQPRLSRIPVKITFSSKTSDKSKAIEGQSRDSEKAVSSASSSSVTRTSRNHESIQKDLQTFMLENESVPFGNTLLALTITE